MPRKLTVLGVLTALVFGALSVFGNANAAIQHFDSTGAFEVDTTVCFGGSPPALPIVPLPANPCGAGSSDSTAPASTPLTQYSVVTIPNGSRLSLGLTFLATGAGWTPAVPACGAVNGTNDCQGGVVSSQVVSGNVYAEANLFCHAIVDAPSYNSDILANGPPATNSPYIPVDFRRSAASPANGGGVPSGGIPLPGSPNAYIPQIVTFPSTFAFEALDTSALDNLWLGGAAPFPLSPTVPLQNASYTSSYVPGLLVSVAILAGSPSPPDSQFLCTDGPQKSVAQSTITTPPAGLYPRWSLYQSAADIVDGTVDRIIDLQCVNVGGFAFVDADKDCSRVGVDTNDANGDVDGDKVPDGIEDVLNVGGGCNIVTTADCDLDGSNDFAEMFELTNPKVADTDLDGSKDKADNGHDESTCAACIDVVPSVPPAPVGATPGTVSDTTVDDSCPTVGDATQLNTDATSTFHGGVAYDATNPDADYDGDACDTDDDNDNIGDVAELGLRIVPWSGFVGTSQTVCKTTGGAAPPTGSAGSVALSTTNGDSDNDMQLDGIECQMSSRPDVSDSRTAGAGGPPGDGATCVKVPVDPKGCAKPDAPAAGGDPDADGLYRPGYGAGDNGLVETFYRTQQVGVGINVALANDNENCAAGLCKAVFCGPGDTKVGAADNDSDCDSIFDGTEVRVYGTSPANPDTDHDGCSDGREVADVNGDRTVSSADLGIVAAAFGSISNADGTVIQTVVTGSAKSNKDFNKDRTISSADLGLVAALFGPCSAAFSNQQQGNTPIDQMKLAPAN